MVGLLAVLAGMAVGALLCALYVRKAHSIGRMQLDRANLQARVQQDDIARLESALAQETNRREALQELKDDLDRELARQQSDASSLRERLDELRSSLERKEQALQETLDRFSNAERQLAALQATHEERLSAYEELKQSLEHTRAQMKTEFQNIASQILEEKGKTFTQTSQSSLDALLRPFREQIDSFQKRVDHIHDESIKGNASLGTQIRQVLEIGMKMSAEANSLALALKGDKKTTGNWGEIQLEKTLQLAGLVKGDHYESQARFKDEQGNARQPDFVIKLPDDKHMVIDSKVSLVDYDRALAATSEAEAMAALEDHARAVRNHIDDLSRKDYTNLIGMRSPSFVLMFMPIEPAYIEALKHNKELFNYGYQRNVIMVSHTTLMPILKTVANLWMIARSNEQAHELSSRAGEIYNQVVVVAENLKKLGDTLAAANNHYNRAVTSLAGRQGLYGKASRFAELSSKATKTMPTLEPLHTDLDIEKLELVVGPSSVNGHQAEPALGAAEEPSV